MNPLAAELNKKIEESAPAVMQMLSQLGQELYYPRGILTQSAEAKEKATRCDATIGEARDHKRAIGLPAVTKHLPGVDIDEALPYAPSSGRSDLRAAWKKEMLEKNPSLGNLPISLPIVTNGITHGLSTISDMFIDPDDLILVPDKLWGNYLMVFEVKRKARVVRYPLLNVERGFDVEGFRHTIEANCQARKMVVLFNFPNNPTGYSINKEEAEAIKEILVSVAENGCQVIAVCDDAYFGLFYDQKTLQESLFVLLANAHPSLLAVKLDGASKEDFAWGLRVGFITYGITDGDAIYEALEKKTAGCIRGTISNCSNLSQTLVLKAMTDVEYRREKAARFAILERRATKAKEILSDPKFLKAWKLYPFTGGYFLCLRLNAIDAEAFRVRLLDKYGIGVISTSNTDIRVAVSCVDEEDLADLFETMLLCALEML